MKKSSRRIIFLIISFTAFYTAMPQIIHKNHGTSQSTGTVSNGRLTNGYKLPYNGDNFKYYSFFDYYILGRSYVHSDIYRITLDSYADLKKIYPDYTFRIMECSGRKGGRSFPHRTHQNGTSIDFMTPLIKDGKTDLFWDHTGMARYALKFDQDGKLSLNKKVQIDFEKLAMHIIALEKNAKKRGYHIKKVILETNLKDELFNSKFGDQLKSSGIYFVKSLTKRINELHDDHYHIDFEELR
ncbi:hypothetical protein ACE1ET_04360 [Saccharicrinis sp. FJH62]|uniref:hypothetical protein n=1 Tax=Saccharicrinis sp. FJH62 TaxID=3344657 RepID=UPI0035D4E7F0